jgi:hypothetical protein
MGVGQVMHSSLSVVASQVDMTSTSDALLLVEVVSVEVHQYWMGRHLVLGLPPSPPPTFLVAT